MDVKYNMNQNIFWSFSFIRDTCVLNLYIYICMYVCITLYIHTYIYIYITILLFAPIYLIFNLGGI